MKLITFQTKKAFEILQRKGILIADVSNIDLQKYGIPYTWMIKEMRKKSILPQNIERYPLWAWAKCGASISPRKKKNINYTKQDLVKITFEKLDCEVLLSDYMAYSFILNGQIVPKTKKEYLNFLEQIDQKGISMEDLKKSVRHQETNPYIPINEIQKTWNRIFNLKSNVYQACVWNIKLSEVLKIEDLNDESFVYGTMNAKRKNGSRPDWKKKYFHFLPN